MRAQHEAPFRCCDLAYAVAVGDAGDIAFDGEREEPFAAQLEEGAAQTVCVH